METLLGKHSPVEHPLPEKAIKTKGKTKQKMRKKFSEFHMQVKFVPNKLQNIISLSKRLGVILV